MSNVQRGRTFKTQVTIPVTLNYLLYLPEGYDPKQRWPLVLFLHGAGERGNDLDQVKNHGLPKLIEEGQEFPFIVVAPQCPKSESWNGKAQIAALSALLDEIERNYTVDPDRIYITGLSMGGYGTWALATAHPQRFAAIAPICGGGNAATVRAIRHVPAWAFHGAKDTVVSLEASQVMVDALKACGGSVRFTVYPDAGHDSWTETYANPELYTWLLQHSRVAEINAEK
jgi:predicted peptidase